MTVMALAAVFTARPRLIELVRARNQFARHLQRAALDGLARELLDIKQITFFSR